MNHRPHIARFYFLGRLQQLPGRGAGVAEYRFSGAPSIKDAIEALGVPHVEAGALHVNGSPAALNSILHSGDDLTIAPDESPLPAPRFILDVHLGSLARALRLLGFDCLYENDYSDPQLAAIAAAEDRALLTRDVGLLKHKVLRRGYWLRSQHTEEQTREVLHRYGLTVEIQPFRRCLSCNGLIAPVSPQEVQQLVPPNVWGFRQEYFRCESCGKVYWKGTHYDRMLEFIKRITQ